MQSCRREEQDKLMIMAMILSKLSRQPSLPMTVTATGLVRVRGFAASGGKAKKGGKGGGDAPKVSTISIEVKATTVVGANILKDGVDPKVLPDGEYPEWLWRLLDKRPPLSELQRRKVESLSYEELRRLVKLDNRARIKEGNAIRAKN